MRREWTLEALIESWTLCEADQELIGAKHGATKRLWDISNLRQPQLSTLPVPFTAVPRS